MAQQQSIPFKPMPVFQKSAGSIVDFGFNWSDVPVPMGFGSWLANAEVITTAQITIDGGDGALSLNPGATSTTILNGIVTFWLGGGTVGQSYNVHCTITTNQGRTDTRTLQVQCVLR